MTEVAENSSATEQVAETSVSNSTSFIGEDGNFVEGWMEKAGVDEEYRSNPSLLTTKNVASLVTQTMNANKLIGKHPDMIVMPNEKSTQTEWDDYHKAGGRPDTPDEYTIKHLDGIGEIDAEGESAFKNFAYSKGFSPSVVQELIEFDDNRTLMAVQAMQEVKIAEAAEATDALKTKWGNAYEERLNLAKRMVNDNTSSEEEKADLLQQMENVPQVADFLANIAKKFVEHKIITAEVDQKTPVEAYAEIETLTNTPGYITGELANTSPARYKQITQEISKLYESLHPEDS